MQGFSGTLRTFALWGGGGGCGGGGAGEGGGARGVCGSTIGFHLLWDTVELAMSTRLCLL